MGNPSDLPTILEFLDKNQEKYVKDLKDVVAIKSVSASLPLRPEVFKMADWIETRIKSLGGTVERIKNPVVQTDDAGKKYDAAPILLGTMSSDPKKKTIMIYAHYDVQPAEKSDGWDTEPFEMVRQADKTFRGRGTTDDKGPLVGWLAVLDAFKNTGKEVPINVKFMLEGMEESGSEGFDEAAFEMKKNNHPFYKDVDACVISDNYWAGTTKPCLTYGLRGLNYFALTIVGAKADMHSGIFGGQVYEPMDDMMKMLASLKTADGKIAIDGIYDEVMAVTDKERDMYKSIAYDLDEKKKDNDLPKLRHEDDKTECIMSVWRNPSLSVHGLEGAFYDKGAKTVIPRGVIGKFSVRTVPNMTPSKVTELVKAHVEKVFKTLGSPNTMKIEATSEGRWWYVDPNVSPVFQAAIKATESVYKVSPDMTREGGSIPITLTLSEVTGKDTVLIPMGQSNDGAHSQNEKLDERNYFCGMKMFAAFFYEAANLE